jgi:hypothetical protein
MYLIEWGWWLMSKMSADKRLEVNLTTSPAIKRMENNFYESEIDAEQNFNSVSDNPRARGPIYAFNDVYMEMRCGGSEEKRGIITLLTIGIMVPMLNIWMPVTAVLVYEDITQSELISWIENMITLFMVVAFFAVFYLYFRYGLQITRLEALTSRQLLIRFNRITQQVHLHRPKYCGGIVTFPWRTTGSGATLPEDDQVTVGLRLVLAWHPSRTGLPHMEMALVGKQGQGGSELRDEWEFIRRYMEDGPESIPRPRLSTQLPSPIQAFSAQFEGIGRFVRNSGWPMKLALLLISPIFVIIGTAHWVSLMLCWRPRWPKIIREAGVPGKPVPPITTLDDYPPETRERLLANADRYELKPGERPVGKTRPRSGRTSKAKKVPTQ